MGSQLVIILGNVGRDPEMRYTQDSKAVCNFSVAVNRGQGNPTWFRVSAWERLAEVCGQYVKKGMTVQVTGWIRANAYINQSGEAVASLELTARDVQFASRSDGEASTDYGEEGFAPPDHATEDIPF